MGNEADRPERTDPRTEYERERERQYVLSEQLKAIRAEEERLRAMSRSVKSGRLFRLMAPLRETVQWVRRRIDSVRRLGSIRTMPQMIRHRRLMKQAARLHGTGSFPDAAERRRQEETVFPRKVIFSILVPLYNTPESFLREMIESVTTQTYGGWELCLADGSDPAHSFVGEICRSYAEADSRIRYRVLDKNLGISGNTNECFKMATGDYIALFDHDDVLHPSVLYEYAKVVNEQDADFIYCDETTFNGLTVDDMVTMHFKPDYAVDNLRANNYICHFSAFSRELLQSDGELFRPQFDGSQDHDMILRLTDRAKKIVHVPKLLYYWRAHKNSTAADLSTKSYAVEATKGAVTAHLNGHGIYGFSLISTPAFDTILQIRYAIQGDPKVSVIVAQYGSPKKEQERLQRLKELTTWKNAEFLTVPVRRKREEAAALNEAAGRADGEYLVFLGGKVQMRTPDWIRELLMYAQRADVACVGAKLWRPDEHIQDAGVTVGLGPHGTAGRFHFGYNKTLFGYMGKLCYGQNMSALSGNCMMIRRSLWQQLGGLSCGYHRELACADLCLRALEAGYLNVFTPFAEGVNAVSALSGYDCSGPVPFARRAESRAFRQRWKAFLEKGDPYFNPNMSLKSPDFAFRKKERT